MPFPSCRRPWIWAGNASSAGSKDKGQAFEYTHELAWNTTLKDFLESRGAGNLYGSRDTTREAFRAGLIENGEAWMNMITSRNLTSHTYDEATAEKIVSDLSVRAILANSGRSRPGLHN